MSVCVYVAIVKLWSFSSLTVFQKFVSGIREVQPKSHDKELQRR